ncbi:SDR family oxidoreductase [Haloechinothrix sp. YIM 98757]|uniref:SDR family oxidoreductase n=1 Tax=Haloechinothrix aidingensis TaxID=2752311 RepID=A0A838AAY3_9PSEU|nr:SDR family oxidoreductase [Haloechinothrix aidingensis]MBA0126393.1 SDR family oxidoreductase [Haloechinothrix aidingensis]
MSHTGTDGLRDRRFVVTGAGRGLGYAIARGIGAAGGSVVLAERDPDIACRAERDLRAGGTMVTRVDTDVADPDSVTRLAERASATGPVHGLVNNAALADGVGGKHFADIAVSEWDRIMTVNTRGPWLVARALYPQLAASGKGRVVNLASDAALYGSPRLSHYVTSKGGVIAMTRAMARDAGPDGVTVNAVAPGLTEVEATEAVPRERHELYARNRALDRPQQADDIVGTVTFLLSDAASYMTGQTLVVNGGFVFT